MVAFLEKSTGSAGFHQVIDFLNRSHICYALTKKPDVYISFIKQFWRSAEATTDDNGELDDQDGITSIPNSEIFEQLALMGYHTDSDKSDEGSLKLNELMNLVTKLAERIGVLEDDLRKTKKTYSFTFTKLILRVKKLESRVKIGKARKRAKVVLSEDDEDKGSAEVSTASATKGTASEVPVVSTAKENISTAGRTVTYRRSEEKRTRKDIGKAIMTESEPKKKSKKDFKQEKLSFAEAIRLQEQMDEEQRAHIARDEEIARQWDEEERQRSMSEAKTSKKIDWNDLSVISERMKSPEKIEEEDVDTQKEMKEVVKESGAKRKKSLPRKRRTVKRQKLEMMLRSEESKGDGSSKNYKVLIKMLEDFDRQDAEELYILVKERYSASIPEGYDLMLWGDLHTLFEPDEEDEI
ncbi:hypothetical protein Tco_0966850 [Tanacetum coccineum]